MATTTAQERIELAFARSIRIPDIVVEQLANSRFWYVRHAVVHDLRVSHDTLVQLSRDPSMPVRYAAEHALIVRAKHAGD